ncbi:MAG: 4Fe-4S binding protein [Oscillospiraceae bacterium]|nr:4Fe-4S binding protein [Oscillospiraceae bacterium]
MSVNSVSLVYFSPTHTTRKAVQAIAKGTALPVKQEINATQPAVREKAYSFAADELLIIGMPVYGGRIPACCFDFVKALQGSKTPAVLVAVYGNRDYDHALIELHELLTPNGFETMACGMFIGTHSYNEEIAKGRPNEADLAQAADFGKSALEKVNSGAAPLTIWNLLKPQSGKKGVAPIISDKCVQCGTCIAGCPTGTIAADYSTDPTKCIMCMACTRYCPTGAIAFAPEVGMDKIAAGCMARFGTPDKENKTLL